ncbi:copper resistance protein NlpE N-terminal domain-containing protein [Roseivirga echinicomitans]
MTFRLFSLTALYAISVISCNSSNKTENSNMIEEHTSQNSLDWAGTYYGVTPCASCEGIETELSITSDLNFTLEMNYLSEDEVTKTTTGKFSWVDGNNIKLEDTNKGESPSMFKIEEGRVRMLDTKGNIIEGDLASHYVLTKSGNLEVEDKKWKLVELNGKAVEGSPYTHYLIFDSKNQRIEAKANCNSLQYEYKIRNTYQLITKQGISTLMACADDLEKEFIDMLNTVDNLSVNGESLTLNKARMAPLAKFELVK